jgi:hypothetical protein
LLFYEKEYHKYALLELPRLEHRTSEYLLSWS